MEQNQVNTDTQVQSAGFSGLVAQALNAGNGSAPVDKTGVTLAVGHRNMLGRAQFAVNMGGNVYSSKVAFVAAYQDQAESLLIGTLGFKPAKAGTTAFAEKEIEVHGLHLSLEAQCHPSKGLVLATYELAEKKKSDGYSKRLTGSQAFGCDEHAVTRLIAYLGACAEIGAEVQATALDVLGALENLDPERAAEMQAKLAEVRKARREAKEQAVTTWAALSATAKAQAAAEKLVNKVKHEAESEGRKQQRDADKKRRRDAAQAKKAAEEASSQVLGATDPAEAAARAADRLAARASEQAAQKAADATQHATEVVGQQSSHIRRQRTTSPLLPQVPNGAF